MKILSCIFAVAFGALTASTPAQASQQTGGMVTIVAVDNSGGPYAFLVEGGTRTTLPACTGGSDIWWVISSPSTDNAKAMYAAILTAYSMKRPVTIVGTGGCDSAAPTREAVAYINAL